jgi:hypothetical protein
MAPENAGTMGFLTSRRLLNRSGYFFCPQAPRTYARLADGPVLFRNLNFFDVRVPFTVCSPGNLAAGDTYPVPGLDAFIAYFTFGHENNPFFQ